MTSIPLPIAVIIACLVIIFVISLIDSVLMGYNPFTNFIAWLTYFLK